MTSVVSATSFSLRCEILGAFLSDSSDGRPALVVPVVDGRMPLDRASGDVILSFRQGGSFEVSGSAFQSDAAIIECSNAALGRTFDVLADDIAKTLTASVQRPTPQEVSRAVARWEELLRGKRQFSREDEIGLWGEIWMLLQLPDTELAVAAWRGPDAEYVDFVGGGVGVECKTGARRLQHFVSQEQVTRPLGDLDVYVLSLWVDQDMTAGESLPEMIAKVDTRLIDPRPFEEKLLATGYSRTDAHRYGLKLRLLEPPLLLPSSAVPRVRSADPGVSHIRFLAALPEEAALAAAPALETMMRLSHAPPNEGEQRPGAHV
jgi:hypothetical protein